jgi:hypothetical protein
LGGFGDQDYVAVESELDYSIDDIEFNLVDYLSFFLQALVEA